MRDTDHAFTRSVERFDSAGVSCVADVYRPREARAQHVPVIVMAQGFGGVRRLCLPSYAERFAAAGYVVALFDYRFFGDSEGSPRELLDIAAQLEDWRAAVSWARTLDGVDPERVVGWGTSFAGGHVLTLAGTGTDFTAVIAQVPHVSGFAAARATGLRQSLRLAPAAIEDLWRSIRGREPRYVASIGPAGSAAVMATADADPAVDRMVAASGMSRDDFPERVAAVGHHVLAAPVRAKHSVSSIDSSSYRGRDSAGRACSYGGGPNSARDHYRVRRRPFRFVHRTTFRAGRGRPAGVSGFERPGATLVDVGDPPKWLCRFEFERHFQQRRFVAMIGGQLDADR